MPESRLPICLMEESAMQTTNRQRHEPSSAAAFVASTSIRAKLIVTEKHTAGRTPRARHQCTVPQTLLCLLSAITSDFAAQLPAFLIQQSLQIIQQASVVFADGFDQIRQWK